jgi:hypothetical protein
MQVEQRHIEAAQRYFGYPLPPADAAYVINAATHFASFEASLPPSAPVDRDAAIETMARAMLKPWVHSDFNDEELAGARKDATAAYDALAALTPSVLAESTSNDCLLVAEAVRERCAGVADAEYNLRIAHYRAAKDAGNKKETRDFETMAIAHSQSASAIRSLDLSGVGVG